MLINDELTDAIIQEINSTGVESVKEDILGHHLREERPDWLIPVSSDIRKYRNHRTTDPWQLIAESLAHAVTRD